MEGGDHTLLETLEVVASEPSREELVEGDKESIGRQVVFYRIDHNSHEAVVQHSAEDSQEEVAQDQDSNQAESHSVTEGPSPYSHPHPC